LKEEIRELRAELAGEAERLLEDEKYEQDNANESQHQQVIASTSPYARYNNATVSHRTS
jgi:hypothetical protein